MSRIIFLILFLLKINNVFANTAEPNFSELIQSVFRVQKLNWKNIEDFYSQSTKSKLFPQLSVTYYYNFKENRDFALDDNLSVSSQGIFIGPKDSSFDESLSQTQYVQFRALWKLSDIIFSTEKLQIDRSMKDLFKVRDNLRDKLYRIYYQRSLLIHQIDHTDYPDQKQRKLIIHQVNHLTELLDEYSNLSFHQRWRRFN